MEPLTGISLEKNTIMDTDTHRINITGSLTSQSTLSLLFNSRTGMYNFLKNRKNESQRQ